MNRPAKTPSDFPEPSADPDMALAAVAKAISHPARIGIMRLLMARTTCVGCDIVEEIGLAQSTI